MTLLPTRECPKCGGGMAEGFIVDARGPGGPATVSKWQGGEPQRGRWFGAHPHADQLEITTWRCGECGYLESYALAPPAP